MKLNPIGSNQNEVILDKCSILFSYKTPVAYIDNKTGQAYQTSKKWSRTTSKHINKWLDGQQSGLVDQSVLDSILDKIEYQELNQIEGK